MIRGAKFVDKDQIYGYFAFEFNDEEFSRGKHRYYEKDIVWDSCGNVVDHTGSSSNNPPPGFINSTQGNNHGLQLDPINEREDH